MKTNPTTSEWALEEAQKAADNGDMEKAQEFQEIAASELAEHNPMEIPVGGIGYFIKAERRGEKVIVD